MKRMRLAARRARGGRDRSRRRAALDEPTPATPKAEPVEPHALGRLDRARARRVQEGRRGVREDAPGRRRQGRRRHQRRQDHRRDPRRQRARRGAARSPPTTPARSALAAPGSTSSRYLEARRGRATTIFPATPRYYTQFKGTRCALPMLADVYGLYYNEDMLREGRADTARRRRSRELTDVREEAHGAEPGRLAQGRRLQPRQGFYAEHAGRTSAPLFGAQVGRRRRQVEPRQRPGVGEAAQVAEGPDRLVRLRQPRQVQGRRRRRVLRLERVRDGQARDEHRRRVARRVHRRPRRPKLNYGTAPVPVDDDKPDLYGAGYTTGNIIGIPKSVEAQGRRPGRCSST